MLSTLKQIAGFNRMFTLLLCHNYLGLIMSVSTGKEKCLITCTIPPCTNVLWLYSSYVRDFFGSCSGTNACRGLPVYAPGVVYRLTLCMLMNCILKHIISTQAYFSIYFSIYIPGWQGTIPVALFCITLAPTSI